MSFAAFARKHIPLTYKVTLEEVPTSRFKPGQRIYYISKSSNNEKVFGTFKYYANKYNYRLYSDDPEYEVWAEWENFTRDRLGYMPRSEVFAA